MPINRIDEGDHTIASFHGSPHFKIPFDGDNTAYIVEQDYVQYAANFSPLALNTVAPTSLIVPSGTATTSFFLQRESEPAPVGVSDLVKWTRSYVMVPASRNEYSTTSYKFIGYAGDTSLMKITSGGVIQNFSGTTYVQGRRPFTETVPLKITNDYFMVGTGGAYANPDAIPVNIAQKYYFQIGSFSISSGVATFTPTYTLGTPNDIAFGLQTEYITDATGTYSYTPQASSPSRATYSGWVASSTPVFINTEDSSITRWMGNIWVRVTKSVAAR